MPALIDLSGQRFAQLLVLHRYSENDTRGKPQWLCRCDCGSTAVVAGSNLKSGNTRSCGCLQPTAARAAKPIHGMTRSPEYVAWAAMKQRCLYPGHRQYRDWGGRGITICPAWIGSFERFFADMGPKPDPSMSLDRIENDGPYAPWNCRWATPAQQRANQRPLSRCAGTANPLT